VGAGNGETVLVLRQGAAAAQVLDVDQPPIRSVIVGIVDKVDAPGCDA
jgi:microcompartment protein CcmK/EutM